MKIKLKCIGSSILITLSFVFGIGVISSIGICLYFVYFYHCTNCGGVCVSRSDYDKTS